jgi:Conjugative transposon protein TcpC
MIGQARVISRPAWRAHWAGRAPRLAFLAVIALLSLAGLRTVLAGPREIVASGRAQPARDLAAEGFAEAFARAYLTWDSAHPGRHERQMSLFTSDALELGAGLQAPAREAQTVAWTAAIRDEQRPRGLRLITVAAETSKSPYYVSVAVQRDRRGFMAVSRYPALVGAPPVASNLGSLDEPPVEDAQLESVVRRALTNYLERQATNLRADLDPRAVVALPPASLRVSSIDTPAWVAPDRVSAGVRAQGSGATWTLSYELAVVKRERWYVRSIEADPRTPG